MNFFATMEQRIRNWFTLGLEEEFTRYGALAEYNTALAQDNLENCGIAAPSAFHCWSLSW